MKKYESFVEKERVKEKKKKKAKPKFIIWIIVILVVLGSGYYLVNYSGFLDITKKLANDTEAFVDEKVIGTEGEVKTISEGEIREVFEISELQTADYIYNAITEVYDEDGKNIKYYVAYEGKVTAGIDFSGIGIEISEDNVINISVPDVLIQDAIVTAGTMEYIFEKEKYNNENVFKEAYDICQKDLNARVEDDTKLLDMAKENARQVVEALIVPWVQQIDSKYVININ